MHVPIACGSARMGLFICVYMGVYMYVYMYVYVCIRMCICRCVHVCVYVWIWMNVCGFECVFFGAEAIQLSLICLHNNPCIRTDEGAS